MEKSLSIELRKQADRSISLIMKYINDGKLNYEELRTKTKKVIDELQEEIPYKLRNIPLEWNESENPVQVTSSKNVLGRYETD